MKGNIISTNPSLLKRPHQRSIKSKDKIMKFFVKKEDDCSPEWDELIVNPNYGIMELVNMIKKCNYMIQGESSYLPHPISKYKEAIKKTYRILKTKFGLSKSEVEDLINPQKELNNKV